MPDISPVDPFWLTAFLDLPADRHSRGVRFWAAVTGYAVSPPRGEHDEFATLVPPDGDDYLRLQRREQGAARIHLDLHVDDVGSATETAAALGASVVSRPDDYVVLRSPGGLTFCHVSHPSSDIPRPSSWPGVRRGRVGQVCLDVPPASYEAESAFWAALVGGTVEVLPSRPEFSWLRGGRQLALDILLQRRDAAGPDDEVAAHLDLGTTDREAEVARHVTHGASVVEVEAFWTVLADPTGLTYCVTDRDPATGRLSARPTPPTKTTRATPGPAH